MLPIQGKALDVRGNYDGMPLGGIYYLMENWMKL